MSLRLTNDGPMAWRRAAVAGLVLLAALLPFELRRPWLVIGSLQVTNLELAAGLALGLGGLTWLIERRAGMVSPDLVGRLPRTWRWLAVWFLAALLVTAVFAPDFRLNALKAGARTAVGLMLALNAAWLTGDPRHARRVVASLLVGGLAAVLLGLIELASGRTFDWLLAFRHLATSVGPFLRLTGSFSHANEAAMYIEATLPLLVGLAITAVRRRRRGWTFLLLLSAGLYLQASLLTYSRASFGTLLIVGGLVAAWRGWRQPPTLRREAAAWAGLVGSVLLLLGISAIFSPVVRLRLSSEGDNEWYAARYEVPAGLTIPAGETISTTVRLANDGLLTWSSEAEHPILLGAHWYLIDAGVQLPDELRWPLPDPVAPGDVANMPITVSAPPWPGRYRLDWDLVQENVIWFSNKNGIRPSSPVTVTESTSGASSSLDLDALPANYLVARPVVVPPIPGRGTLWPIAGRLFLERPLLGIGLDNFRLIYGRELDWPVWNDTIHTNNLYLETLVSLGLVGGVPFLSWLFLLLADILDRLRQVTLAPWQAGLAAALLTFMVHGLLDYFLLFNATGLLFWLLAGLWIGQRRPAGSKEVS